MSKWTPGPWYWDSDPVKNDPMGRIRYRVVALGKTISQIYYSSFEGGKTNADADARLIAAAPEMAEALQHAYLIGQGGISPLPETLAKWNAILAKING